MRNQSKLLTTLVSSASQDPMIAQELSQLRSAFWDQACLFRCICHLGGIDKEDDQLAIALIARRLSLMQSDFFVDHNKICALVSLVSGVHITYVGREVPDQVNGRGASIYHIVDHWVFQDPNGHFVCEGYDPKPGSNAVTRGKVVGHRVYEVRNG